MVWVTIRAKSKNDNNELRFWMLAVDRELKDYTDPPDLDSFKEIHRGASGGFGGEMILNIPGSPKFLSFLISAFSGASYSGTITVNGVTTNFQKVDAYHPVHVELNPVG